MSTTNESRTDWIRRAEGLRPLRIRNLIDGRFSDVGGAPLDKLSPRDGTVLSRFGGGDSAEVDVAVASARRAFEDGRWSMLPQQRRKDILLKLAAMMERHLEELALLECLDVGKPISDALSFDVPYAAAQIRHGAEAADHLYGKVYGTDQSSLSYELRRPLGVVAGIVGWNFPLVLACQKIGPALATGNSLILKPSEFTSLSAARVAELALEAGVPEGVFNVVHGNGAVGAALALHRDVDLVTFTGSSATGKKVMIAAGQSNMKRLLLECGGKAPNIVFEDAPDLDAVAERVVARAFWNQGQVCTASSRLMVHEGIKDELLRRVIDKVLALNPGDPLKAETRFGAIVSREQRSKVLGYLGSAEQDGARMIYQSSAAAPFANGFYIAPTIYDKVTSSQRIAQEEIFGPVLSVLSFRTDEEAVQIANGTMYGLSAILWTRDLGRAHRMTQGIRAGWITVSATGMPTGGPGGSAIEIGGHKESGFGVEGGIDGLKAYTSQTAVQWFV